MGLLKFGPRERSSDGALLCLAAAAPGVAARSSKGGPGGSGRGVQQDETRHPSCDCQVSRTRIAYHLHRRKGCKRASNSYTGCFLVLVA